MGSKRKICNKTIMSFIIVAVAPEDRNLRGWDLSLFVCFKSTSSAQIWVSAFLGRLVVGSETFDATIFFSFRGVFRSFCILHSYVFGKKSLIFEVLNID